jgi:hypothetical protein
MAGSEMSKRLGKRPPTKEYAAGGLVQGVKSGIKPTNQKTVKMTGGGAAERGTNIKV